MNRAYRKDIFRSIKNEWKRFLSIIIITTLGVGMFSGLYAACYDMYYSANKLYDSQNLFDIRILSTLGLTNEDKEKIAEIEGVESVIGSYSEIVDTIVSDSRKTTEVMLLNNDGINVPYLISGKMPIIEGEIAVTQKYLDESGKTIGDTVTIEESNSVSSDISNSEFEADNEEEKPNFKNTTYTITAVVLDPMNIQSNGNGSEFRASNSADYTFFITKENTVFDIYTAVYITVSGTTQLDSFSDEYVNIIDNVIAKIDKQLKSEREQVRYDNVLIEAKIKIEDAEKKMKEKFAEADIKLNDAWVELNDGEKELADGVLKLSNEKKEAEQKFAEALKELEDAKQKLIDVEAELADGEKKLKNGESELIIKEKELNKGIKDFEENKKNALNELAAAEKKLSDAKKDLDQAKIKSDAEIVKLKSSLGTAWPEKEWDALVNAAASIASTGADQETVTKRTTAESTALVIALNNVSPQLGDLPENSVKAAIGNGMIIGSQKILDNKKIAFSEQKKATLKQLDDAEAELNNGKVKLSEARATLEANKKDLAKAKIEISNAKTELAEGEEKYYKEKADAEAKISDAEKELSDGKKELEDGKAELIEEENDYKEKRAEAEQKISDAYAELDDIEMTRWYIQDRTSLDSYSSLDSDLSSISAIGKIFPILFLLVAVLMSLTTMTRMVEEERGLIGIFKALGFSNVAIYGKYLIFAFLACLIGGGIGDLFGFFLMPQFISVILEELYTVPDFYFRFDILYGVGGIILFMAAIVGATFFACRSELKQTPATLLRPKSPKAGTRVLLERVTFIWNRLKFLNKVTVRNLFRYKKRLFMTIGGIMGCTALILMGFAIKDSVAGLAPLQYKEIYKYDLLAVFNEDDNNKKVDELSTNENIEKLLNLRVESIKLINSKGQTVKLQLLVVPENKVLDDYINLLDTKRTRISISDDGIIVTQNAMKLLGLKEGSTVYLQNDALKQKEATVTAVSENYLGNNVYMTQKVYESLFGAYKENGVLAAFPDTFYDQKAFIEQLKEDKSVLSALNSDELIENFSFELIDAVVLFLIVMAGGLAFVVLFTLSNTNISERMRELATIKVLGFFDNEVYQYVNKETIILTAVGIVGGLPLGRLLSNALISVLNMPGIYFSVQVEPLSYLYAVGITICFAFIVNLLTNKSLDRINMVEALKSVE